MKSVSVLLRIRENGKYPFVTPVWLIPAKKLKPLWGIVNGVPIERPDGSYYLRYTHPCEDDQTRRGISRRVRSRPGRKLRLYRVAGHQTQFPPHSQNLFKQTFLV